jgi:uncharacterized protein YidB (DUF937 family)
VKTIDRQEMKMGLLDVLNGMQNGPRGQRPPAPTSTGSGTSPIAMAIMGLLAYKAVKHLGGSQSSPGSPSSGGTVVAQGGGLGDLLKGGAGGLLAGSGAGSVLSGGLNDLLKQFQQKGQSEVANSWVGKGPNKQISPDVLSKVLSEDQIKMLTQQTGMSQAELVNALSEHLPNVVNHLTPEGRLPTEHEASRWL